MRPLLLVALLLFAAPAFAQFVPVGPDATASGLSCVELVGDDDGLGFSVRAHRVRFHAAEMHGRCPALSFDDVLLRVPDGRVWTATHAELDAETLLFRGLNGPGAPDEWVVDERGWSVHSAEDARSGLTNAELGLGRSQDASASVAALMPLRQHALSLAARATTSGVGGGLVLRNPANDALRVDGGWHDGAGTLFARGAWHHRSGPFVLSLDADRALGDGRARFAGTPLRALATDEHARITLAARDGGLGLSVRLQRERSQRSGPVRTSADLDVGAGARNGLFDLGWAAALHVGELAPGVVRTGVAAEWSALGDVAPGSLVASPVVRVTWSTEDGGSAQYTRLRAVTGFEFGWRHRSSRALIYGELGGAPFSGGARPGDVRAARLWRADEGTASLSLTLGSAVTRGGTTLDASATGRLAERSASDDEAPPLGYVGTAGVRGGVMHARLISGAQTATAPTWARAELGAQTESAGLYLGAHLARSDSAVVAVAHGPLPLRRAVSAPLAGDTLLSGFCGAVGRVRLRGEVVALPSATPDISGWGVLGVSLGERAGWLRVDAGADLQDRASAFIGWESGRAPSMPGASGRALPWTGCGAS